MRMFSFGPEAGRHVDRHGSDFRLSRLAHPQGIHLGCMYLGPGGLVGYHPAATYQLLAVVEGDGDNYALCTEGRSAMLDHLQ